MQILIFGPQGTGKTIVGRKLAKILNVEHIEFDDFDFMQRKGALPPCVLTTNICPLGFDMENRLHIDAATTLVELAEENAIAPYLGRIVSALEDLKPFRPTGPG